MTDLLSEAIDARRDELVALTQDLIRIPTSIRPATTTATSASSSPGRLRASGFADRADPRRRRHRRQRQISALERRRPPRGRGRRASPCTSTRTSTWCEPGSGWTVDPFGGEVKDGKVYGRGACDMKGGLAASIIAAEAFIDVYPDFRRRHRDLRHRRRGNGRLWRRRLSRRARLFLAGPGPARHHSRAAQQGPRLPRPSRRLVGRDRNQGPHRPRLDAVPRRQRHPPHGRACSAEIEDELYPALAHKHTAMPVVPPQARQSTMNINSHPWRPARARGGLHRLSRRRWSPHSARMVIDRRYLIEESAAAVRQEIVDLLGAREGHAAPASATSCATSGRSARP